MDTILIIAIRIYQWLISPAKVFVFGPGARCRFTPTCSGYAIESIRQHGTMRGCWLAIKRLARCHPWGGCGCDPVPHSLPNHPSLTRRPASALFSFSASQPGLRFGRTQGHHPGR